ncbi:TetR/AcrR family transcriptional regulator [Luteipulveratus halotolerans]|uniref:HTH tetR-type domain-containing protein n=1 Tax=Luteipulveratus halotolerans TaxID=1631356 RepID=A0A0L6CHI8_9MICO|nr:TetR/AcrR family transcriptional regulator [Luteipulveratus halotolerans]KNX37060.1 hypothetical protein VV01_07725 [Luteipulveratus halotolerans]
MPRWSPGAQDRLVQSALDLFDEQGYDQTNVAEIAARAGVTERTYYRHFTDKREVLFGTFGDLTEQLSTAVTAAPEDASALRAAQVGLTTLAEALGDQPRDRARQRSRVLAATASLRERELLKMEAWTSAVASALRGRDVPDDIAQIAAATAIGAFQVAFRRWTGPGRAPGLVKCLDEAFSQARSL